ncbi:MAG: MerR family transcriptional regulator [Anaerolineales bacterium]
MTFSQTPTYNLKAVLKETGMKPDVLRAWERRYGMPTPQRTPGGHRLYSQQDVETLKWLLARQGEGLSISRAVDLWREMQTGGRNPLAEYRQTAVSAPKTPTGPAAPTSLDAARREWLAACLAFNEPLAEQALNQAFALYPVETVCVEVLEKGLAEMGGLWYESRASVQQEHFASGLVMRRLDALLAASPAPTRSQTVLIGCPPDEWHSFTSLLLALFLRRRGLNVIYLGANVPDHRFEETVTTVGADLVVLVAQQLITAAALQKTAAALSAHGVSVGYGGRIFSLQPDLQKRIAGRFLGNDLVSALENIDAVLVAPYHTVQAVLPEPGYVETLQAFLSKRFLIDADLDKSAHIIQMPIEYTHTAGQFLGDNMVAALCLGDMAFLDAEVDWLKALLEAQKLPFQLAHDYFQVYLEVVRRQLDDRAAPIIAWLERQIELSKN